ncbi:MAG: tetratricopeptide repeat protein [Myxococcales bacterium]|nr:tetratricopeptide repeat protein [Myxococcales bacterium]
MPLRCAALLVCALIGCGGRAQPVLRPGGPSTAPAADLDNARPTQPSPVREDGERPGSAAAPHDPRVIDLDTIRIQVVGRTPTGAPELSAVATADLFSEASAAWKNGQGDLAIGLFRRLVSDFPDSTYAPLSLYNIAAIYDRRGDPSATISVLRELIASYPTSRKSVEAHLYLAAMFAERRQFADSLVTLDQALARQNLTFADRVEGGARKGYVLLELGRLEEAEAALALAVSHWRQAPHLEDAYFIAMAQYYRAEVLHRRFLAAKVELPDDNLGKSLAAKEALAVAAYDQWRTALGHRHAYWATAAGYQMSQIFVELWEATVRAPFPTAMSAEARPLYVAEVRSRVRSHLQKALEGHRMNLELAKAYGVTTPWSDGSKMQVLQIQEILGKESQARQ